MNKERRRDIDSAIELIEAAKAILENCRDGEQDYFDNMPESFQDSDKGLAAEQSLDALDTMIDSLDEAILARGDIA